MVIFLLFPVINALTLLITALAGGTWPDFAFAQNLAVSPNLIVSSLIFLFIFGALAEEYGWRGYALDRLQARWGPTIGSLLLGGLWAVWHLPLFFIYGAPHHDSGQYFLLFAASIIAISPIYTWVYNGTGRSMAAMLLLHLVFNATDTILPAGQSNTIGLVIISGAILVAWQRRARQAMPELVEKGKMA